MSRSSNASSRRGFTLIELLVIAPIAMLVISGFIALMVTMVGDVIAGRAYNVMTYDIQSALNTIEQDVRLSTQFLATSGTMLSPQGKNGATSAFTSTGDDLILGEITTDKNPVDPTRSFIYYDAPFGCGDPAQIYKNRIHFMTVIYFVRDGSLWRRTYVPAASGTLCQQPWQVNTCAPGYVTSAQCQTNDSEILKYVNDFDVKYYANPQDTVELSAAQATQASSIKITLSGQTLAAGRTVSATSSARSTKLSDKDISLPVPSAPNPTATAASGEALFTWPGVPNATSYMVQYNINGGGWITASENSTDTSFSVAGARGDTVSLKVFARNTTGTSAEANASATIPLWTDCALQNGWANYTTSTGYETCGYTITKSGVVMLKGHISSGSTAANVALFQLPTNLRPSNRLMFQMVINPNSSTRIDVNDDGWVRLAAGTSSTYVGLDGIYFIPKDTLYKWTTPTLINGWTAFGSGFPTLQTTKDSSGRVHLQGLIKQGTYSMDTPIAQLPAGSTTNEFYNLPARGDSYNTMGINQTGQIVAKNISSSYYSTQAMFYPSSFSGFPDNPGYPGWQSFSGTVAGNPADGQMGNNWVAYGFVSGVQYATPQYIKSPDGIVTLKGLIRWGTASDNVFIAKLPAGYRPKKTLAFSTSSNSGVARIDIGESGYIIYRAGSNGWMSLSNISYMAEQ